MRNIIVLIFMFYNIVGGAQKSDNDLTVMSYNIRYNNPNDGVNIWENRKEWLTNSIKFFGADLVGAQEVTYDQLTDMKGLLQKYRQVGEGRLGGKKGEYSPIFYLKDRFELLESNTFWLSQTTNEVGSKGWDAALPRIVTWAKFRDKKSGKPFYFFNTHFDHKGKIARKKSAKIITAKIEQIAGGKPIILTGDFNVPPYSEPYTIILESGLKDTFLKAPQVYGPEYTANGWDVKAEGEHSRIDYVFYKGKDLSPIKYHVLDGQRGTRFISDHFPAIVTFKLQNIPNSSSRK